MLTVGETGRITGPSDDTILSRGRSTEPSSRMPAASDRARTRSTSAAAGRSPFSTPARCSAGATASSPSPRARRRGSRTGARSSATRRRHRPPRRRHPPHQPRDDRGRGLRLRCRRRRPTATPAGEDEVRNFGSIEGGVFLYALGRLRRKPRRDRFHRPRRRRRHLFRARHRQRRPRRRRRRQGPAGQQPGRRHLHRRRSRRSSSSSSAGAATIGSSTSAGQDEIDLSTFGFSRFAEVRSLIEDRPNGSLIDLSDDGLTIFLRGVDKADLRAIGLHPRTAGHVDKRPALRRASSA